MKASGKTRHVNNGNRTGTDMFGSRVFSMIVLYRTAVAMTVIAQSTQGSTVTSASAQPGVYQGIGAPGEWPTGRTVLQPGRPASVGQWLPVENVCAFTRAIGEAVF